MTGKELNELISQLNRQLQDKLDKYISLDDGMACLDDWYTADELRQVADVLDEIARKKTEDVVSLGGKPILRLRNYDNYSR